MSLKDFSIINKLGTIISYFRLGRILDCLQSITSKRPPNLRPQKSQTRQPLRKINIKCPQRSQNLGLYQKQQHHWI
jgi:hypothetical protein